MKFVKASLYLSVALAITACGEEVSVETYLENAKSYQSEKKFNESIIEYKNAILADQQNAEARFLLGKLYLSLGDGIAATKELERARALKYSNNEVLPLLARAYILTDSDADVISLNIAAQDLSTEARNQYLAYQTLAEIRSEDEKSAQKSVELAQSIAPKSLYTLLAQAYLKLAENKPEEANTLINKILKVDADHSDTLMLQGQVAMVTEDYKAAVSSFMRFMELQPRFIQIKLLIANSLLKAKEFDKAEEFADEILTRVNNQPFANYIKAMVRFEKQDYILASEHAEAALSSGFKQFNLKVVAGASAFYLNNWQQSYHHLSAIVDYVPNDHIAHRMLAVTQLELGLINEINDTLNNLDTESDINAEFISSLSYKLLERGATAEAQVLLEKNDESIKNVAQNARQGILKLMMNDLSGVDNLEEAIELNPDFFEAELALAFVALQEGDLVRAKAIAEKWVVRYPDKASSFNLLASVAIKEKDYEKAEKALKESLKLKPNDFYALTEQLRIARKQKNVPLSKKRADHLLSLSPKDTKVLRQYFGVYRNEMALAKIAAVYAEDESNLNKMLLLAEAMLNLGQDKKAEKLLVSKAESKNLPKQYWKLLVLSYRKLNNPEKMQLTLETWLKENPYHLEAIILLADFYTAQRNNERALTIVKRGLKKHKDNLTLELIQMQLLLNTQQIQSAREFYKTIQERDINEALKEGFLGQIFLLEQDYTQAIPKLIAFYQAYPTSQNVRYLAGAYAGNNENDKAAQILEHYLVDNPNNNAIKILLAGRYLNGNAKKSIIAYNNVIKTDPDNVVAHNNLAWLYMEENKIDKALEHAKKALDIEPEVANIIDTYAVVLLRSGNKVAALKHANEAVKLTFGQDVDIQLNYIEILIANKRVNEAENQLKNVKVKTEEQKKKKAKLLAQL